MAALEISISAGGTHQTASQPNSVAARGCAEAISSLNCNLPDGVTSLQTVKVGHLAGVAAPSAAQTSAPQRRKRHPQVPQGYHCKPQTVALQAAGARLAAG
jgi:hypothetical protein